jgi:hypothetical protein
MEALEEEVDEVTEKDTKTPEATQGRPVLRSIALAASIGGGRARRVVQPTST